MKTPEINALETRFKATVLMLINLELDQNERVNELIEVSTALFDGKEYNSFKKALDLLDSVIVEILES